MPRGGDAQVAVLDGGGGVHDAAHAVFVAGEGVAEFPEGVAL